MTSDVNEDSNYDVLLASHHKERSRRDEKKRDDDEHRSRRDDDEHRSRRDDDEHRSRRGDEEDHRREGERGKRKRSRHRDEKKRDDDEHRSRRGDEEDHRRDRRDDKRRERRKERSRDRKKGKKSSKSSGGSKEEGGGLRDMSVGEMNDLRAQLGLKPLVVDERSREEEIEQREKARKIQETMELEDKILLLKNQRMKREKQRKKPKNITTLGDSDSDDDTAASWVEKARQVKEEQKLAEERAKILKHLQDEEESDSDNDPVGLKEEKKQNGSATSGLKVLHGVQDFQDGTTILTLADQKIVERGVIINEEDELENIELVENSKTKKFNEIRTGKHKFNPYEDNPDRLLPQYDESNPIEREKEERKKNAFMLTEQGIELSAEAKEERIHAKLEEAKKQKALVDGSMQLREASDYYTTEELVQFKTKNKEKVRTKRTRRRKKLADELAQLEVQEKENESDLGSRSDRQARLREEKLMEVVSVIEKRENYKKAIEKAEADSKWLYTEENNNEDEDFYNALANTRKLVQEERKNREEVIVDQVDQFAIEQRQAKKKDTRIVFNATTEFIKSIPTAQEDGMDIDTEETFDFATIRQKQKERERKRKRSLDDDDIDFEPFVKEQKVEGMSSPNSHMDDDGEKLQNEPIEEVMGEEPLVGKGMGATLALIRARGGLDSLSMDTTTGRASDKKIDPFNKDGDLVRLEYVDENGRQMSQKEAFRRISYSFHGKAPGKSKLEKRMKRNQEEMRRKNMSTTDTPLLTLSAMQKTQEQSKLPYVIMSGNTSKILERSVLSAPLPPNTGSSPGRNTPRSKHKTQNRPTGGGTFKEIPLENSIPLKEEVVEKKVSFGFK